MWVIWILVVGAVVILLINIGIASCEIWKYRKLREEREDADS